MRSAAVAYFCALAVSAAHAQMRPMSLFTVTGESTDGVKICQQEGIDECTRIDLHPEALAMEELDIMGNYYRRSHVVDKDDQIMYGYEVSESFRVVGRKGGA